MPTERTDQERLLEQRYNAAKSNRDAMIKRAMIDLLYYAGEQMSYFRPGTNTLLRPESDKIVDDLSSFNAKRTFYITVNKIKPAVDVAVSLLVQRDPTLFLVPKSESDKSRNVAKAGTDLLDSYKKRGKYQVKDLENATWTVVTGTGYKWVHPVIIDSVEVPDPKDKNKKIDEPTESDVVCTILSPFEFMGCPGIRDVDEKMPWCWVEKYCPRQETNDRFDLKLEEASSSEISEFAKNVNMMSGETRYDQVLVKEYFEAPSKKNPRGYHAVMVEDKIVDSGDHPNWNKNKDGKEVWGGYRITKYIYNDNLISHWGSGLPRTVISIQKMINLLRTMHVTNRVLTLIYKIFIDGNMKHTEKLLSNFPEIITLKTIGQQLPQVMTPPTIPPDVNQ